MKIYDEALEILVNTNRLGEVFRYLDYEKLVIALQNAKKQEKLLELYKQFADTVEKQMGGFIGWIGLRETFDKIKEMENKMEVKRGTNDN